MRNTGIRREEEGRGTEVRGEGASHRKVFMKGKELATGMEAWSVAELRKERGVSEGCPKGGTGGK